MVIATLALAAVTLLDFETPGSFRIVPQDVEHGGVAATNRCATSGRHALWMGPLGGEEPKENYGFAEVAWTDPALNDWSAADRLAFDVTNVSSDERALVFYLYDSRRKKSQKARYKFTLPPRTTRRVEAELDWTKIDIDRRDVRAIAFVHCSPDFGSIFIDRVTLLEPGETPPAEPAARAFGPVCDEVAAFERAKMAERERRRDEEERQRVIRFRQELEAARPVQAKRLAAFVARLAASGEDVSSMVVLQADAMRQIRPRDTDFSSLSPAKGISLRLAQEEYEDAQIAVAAPGAEALRGVRAQVEGDVAARLQVTVEPVGYTLADAPLRHGIGYCVPSATNACGYIRLKRPTPLGWYADPILPFLKAVDVVPGDVQSFLVRVKAPEGTPAGVYRGAVRVTAASAPDRVVPLAVRVNGFSVGKVSELPLLVTFTPFVQPLSLSWTQRQAAERRADPEAPVNLWKRHREEWSDFLGEYFLLPSTIYPAKGERIPDFDLIRRAASRGRVGPFIVAPWSMCDDEAKWRATYLENLRKRYAEACAAGLGKYAMTYGCDETEPEHFPKVRKALEILKREIPEVPVITTSTDAELGVGSPLAGVDAFCPLTTAWRPEKVAASRAAGHKVWWYVACGECAPYANLFVQNPLSEGRLLMGAQAFRMKPDGFLYYAIAKWNQRRPITSGPFTDWSPHGIRHRNAKAMDGDGVWTYCGPDGTPLATLRLENFRDGVEDYNYAKILERLYLARADKSDAWAREAKRLLDVPLSVMESLTNYTDDPAAVYAWRDRMADLIESADAGKR